MKDPEREVEVCGMQMEGRPIQNRAGNATKKLSKVNDHTTYRPQGGLSNDGENGTLREPVWKVIFTLHL